MWMDEHVDTGDLILQRWEPIRAEDDAGTLASRLAEIGAPLLARSLALAFRGEAPRIPQERGAGSYAGKLTKTDGIIDWTLGVEMVWARQRAVTPWPGAVTGHRGRSLRVLRSRPIHDLAGSAPAGAVLGVEEDGVAVACGRGALLLERVKPEGRSEMSGPDWARGARIGADERLADIQEAPA